MRIPPPEDDQHLNQSQVTAFSIYYPHHSAKKRLPDPNLIKQLPCQSPGRHLIIYLQGSLTADVRHKSELLLTPDAYYNQIVAAIAILMRRQGRTSIELRRFDLNESGLLEGVTATKLATNPREPGSVLAASGLSGNLQGNGFKIGKK
jgi:hypothetical protein